MRTNPSFHALEAVAVLAHPSDPRIECHSPPNRKLPMIRLERRQRTSHTAVSEESFRDKTVKSYLTEGTKTKTYFVPSKLGNAYTPHLTADVMQLARLWDLEEKAASDGHVIGGNSGFLIQGYTATCTPGLLASCNSLDHGENIPILDIFILAPTDQTFAIRTKCNGANAIL